MPKVAKTVFVLMPFREDFDDVYSVIKDAVSDVSKSAGIAIRCLRADEISTPGLITDQIIEGIGDADLLIADLTGSNPNVMYELGYAHALNKPVIILNQDVLKSPFDVKAFRQVPYDRSRVVRDCRPSLITAIQAVFGGGSAAIVFRSPTSNSTVPQFVDVEYEVSGKIPARCRPILFVGDPLGQYWSWGSTSTGHHRRVQLGSDVDAGMLFEIAVLVTRNTVEVGRPLTQLPPGTAYQAIEVRRS
jgi:hypothetical protein